LIQSKCNSNDFFDGTTIDIKGEEYV